MAENNGITEVKALETVLGWISDGYIPADEKAVDEVAEKLTHMVEVRSRKRERKSDNSKTIANIALGEQFAEQFTGETFKAADVANFHGVSVAKASAICKAMGWEKVPSTEKVAVYTL